jgi:hypothetical protein
MIGNALAIFSWINHQKEAMNFYSWMTILSGAGLMLQVAYSRWRHPNLDRSSGDLEDE